MGKAEPLPGTSDISYPEVQDWVTLESAARDIFARYGYSELRTPVFERTEVFTKSIGDETDVVQKEMYTFTDRGNRSLTLRPEGTAGVMRAIANIGLVQGEEQRVFYMGPMFRGERPAAGRKRQFHQVGVENVGSCLPLVDAENIAMLANFLRSVGIDGFKIKVNSRGTKADRKPAEDALREHFAQHVDGMCEDCQRRFNTNIWRMLDCKQEGCQAPISEAPDTFELLGEESCNYFRKVCEALDSMGVEYTADPRLVRGLDYYVHTVFEVSHSGLGAQDAIAGGGRYEITVPGGKKPVQGVGFAAGMERLLMARESLGVKAEAQGQTDVFLVSMGEAALMGNLSLATALRAAGLRVQMDYEVRSMKAQMRRANRLAAPFTVICGDEELANQAVQVKDLESGDQSTVALDQVVQFIKEKLG